MPRFLVYSFLLAGFLNMRASDLDKAYASLKEYDYFKAKKIFYRQLKKHPAEAASGLATIYYRQDNPFYNLDSAYKYVQMGLYAYVRKATDEKKQILLKYRFSDTTLRILEFNICTQAFKAFSAAISIKSAELYLQKYFTSPFTTQVLCMRDSIAYAEIQQNTHSASIKRYIQTYPESCKLQDALELLEYTTYTEITADEKEESYLNYLKQKACKKYVQQAKESLLACYIKNKNPEGIYYYIKNINPSYYAWNALFGLEMKEYTVQHLQAFLQKYPDYPDKNQLEEEFKYWKKKLLAVKVEGKWGFIDTTGSICIEPVYDEVEEFKEGYALVQKNNVFGFINKAGRLKIDFLFEEASSFAEQTAIVQQNNKAFLIDHAAKKISEEYDEIADFSDELAIVKKNNLYGAINRQGEEIIKPDFSSLNDFSEGLAACIRNNKYGFVNMQGFITIAPVFSWVSSFKNRQCRVKIENRLGVINQRGDFVILPEYDFISEPYKGMYLLMKNNVYGFADTSGCLLTEIKYSYNPALKMNEWCNGSYMRLIKNNSEELQDRNGIRYLIQEKVSQIQLGPDDIIAAKKNRSMQFYSINKSNATNALFRQIYTDMNYWYGIQDKGCKVFPIHLPKESLFTLKAQKITYLSAGLFQYETENGKGLVFPTGTIALPAYFEDITLTEIPHILKIERNEKGAYFNVNTLTFIWQEKGFNSAYIAEEE